MKAWLVIVTTFFFILGCTEKHEKTLPTPQFEIREFVIAEEKTEATQYSKEWNSFKGTGTLIARNVEPNRNLLVWLEYRDNVVGANAEPQFTAILFRGGVGKIEVQKSKYGEISVRPDYKWSVLGWQELNPASVTGP